MQYISSFETAEKHISAKIFRENLHTSVKILQICMDLQDSVQRSLQNPAEKSCRCAQNRKDRKPGHVFYNIQKVHVQNFQFICFLYLRSKFCDLWLHLRPILWLNLKSS